MTLSRWRLISPRANATSASSRLRLSRMRASCQSPVESQQLSVNRIAVLPFVPSSCSRRRISARPARSASSEDSTRGHPSRSMMATKASAACTTALDAGLGSALAAISPEVFRVGRLPATNQPRRSAMAEIHACRSGRIERTGFLARRRRMRQDPPAAASCQGKSVAELRTAGSRLPHRPRRRGMRQQWRVTCRS